LEALMSYVNGWKENGMQKRWVSLAVAAKRVNLSPNGLKYHLFNSQTGIEWRRPTPRGHIQVEFDSVVAFEQRMRENK
jgi:hypothetical protein